MGGSSSGGSNPAPYGYDHTGRAVGKAERDAWNAKRKQTGLGGTELKNYLDSQRQQQMYTSMMGMFETGGEEGFHGPTGPSEEELEATRLEEGAKDLNNAYNSYIDAGLTATDYVNKQIAKDRANAALLGMDFNITDEQKQNDISDYFSTIYGADEWDTLKQLDTDFGDVDNPLEYLITRGAALDTDTEAEGDTNTSTARTGGTTLISEEETLGTSTLLGG